MLRRIAAASFTSLLLAASTQAQVCEPIVLPRADGPLSGSIQAMGSGDMNHDGRADLIVCLAGRLTKVYFGRADGTFSDPVVTDMGADFPIVRTVIADITGDGIPDIYSDLTVNSLTTPPRLFVGHADGTFTPGQIFEMSCITSAIADINGDGRPDVIGFRNSASGAATNELRIFLNAGNGVFNPISPGLNLTSNGRVIVDDFNSDGRPDLLLLLFTGSIISTQVVTQGAPLSPGGLGPFALQPLVSLGTGLTGFVRHIDVTGDGIPDLINGLPNSFMNICRGLGRGTFSPAQPFGSLDNIGPTGTFAPSDNTVNLVVADVNGDGRPDLVRHFLDQLQQAPTQVLVRYNLGGGNFSSIFNYDGSSTRLCHAGIAVGDFDGNGSPDIIVDGVSAFSTDTAPFSILRSALPTQVVITVPPAPAHTRPGQTATFTVAATGSNLTYRWFKNGVPLPTDAENGRISGVATPTLTIAETRPDDSGSYTVEVANTCFTRQASTYLDTAPACGNIDFNHDGDLNADDLGDFITAYFGGC